MFKSRVAKHRIIKRLPPLRLAQSCSCYKNDTLRIYTAEKNELFRGSFFLIINDFTLRFPGDTAERTLIFLSPPVFPFTLSSNMYSNV